MRWQLSTPARIACIGPSGSGKSHIVRKLIADTSVWDRKFAKVVYTAPSLDDREEYLDSLRSVCQANEQELLLLDRVPTAEELRQFGSGAPILYIADDLLGFANTAPLQNLITINSHHLHISCVFCVQNPFLRSGKLDLTTLSRNLTARFLLYATSDWLLLKNLSNRLFPERRNFLIDCLNLVRSKYGLNYVVVNTASFSDVERRYICYSAVFTSERAQFGGSPLFLDLVPARR